jgi:hypothetical protein
MTLVNENYAPSPHRLRSDDFRQTISREVQCSDLSRAISMEGLLKARGDFDDHILMRIHIGTKYIGRSLCPCGFTQARRLHIFQIARSSRSREKENMKGVEEENATAFSMLLFTEIRSLDFGISFFASSGAKIATQKSG